MPTKTYLTALREWVARSVKLGCAKPVVEWGVSPRLLFEGVCLSKKKFPVPGGYLNKGVLLSCPGKLIMWLARSERPKKQQEVNF